MINLDEVLEKWNKKWKGYALTFLFSDLEPVVLDFFKHLVFIDANKRNHVYTATKKVSSSIFVFDFFAIHTKTNQRYLISFSDIQCSIYENEKEIRWNKLFHLDLNIPKNAHLTYQIRSLLHKFNIEEFANEMVEMKGKHHGTIPSNL